jgi:uncharacterized protein (PEP-CTERM system associated)
MSLRIRNSELWILLGLTMPVATQAEVTVSPRVSVAEIITDNARLAESSSRESEQITQISPGVRIDVNGARVKTYFDYALTQSMYAQNTSPSRSQKTLSTFGTVEAVDNRVFFDFNASISQQSFVPLCSGNIGCHCELRGSI